MTLCDLTENIPTGCPELQDFLQQLIVLLSFADHIKSGSGDHEPTWAELSALWEGCIVPPASFVFWYNTDSTYISWWFNPTGSYYEELG